MMPRPTTPPPWTGPKTSTALKTGPVSYSPSCSRHPPAKLRPLGGGVLSFLLPIAQMIPGMLLLILATSPRVSPPAPSRIEPFPPPKEAGRRR